MTQQTPTVIQKALSKLEKHLDSGQAYEGHELFKTAFHRLRARQLKSESHELAFKGSILQLQRGQLNCGVELALMLIEAYETDGIPASRDKVENVLKIVETLPKKPVGDDDEPPVKAAENIAGAAFKWIRKTKNFDMAPLVHQAVANHVTSCLGVMGLGIAMHHFARSPDLASFARAVASAVEAGGPGEEDLFVVRASLMLADVAQPIGDSIHETPISRAQNFIASYESVAGHLLDDTPLIGFLTLYLEALQRRSHELSALILQEYDEDLSERDPDLKTLAKQCKERHAPSPVQPGGFPSGLFEGFMRGMMAPPAR